MHSLAAAFFSTATLSLAPQGGDGDLEAVLRAEAARVATMARVQPSVCSVMRRGAPGGGSGVIFDPAGFVLTNFHVVGKRDLKRMVIGLPDGNLYEATVLGIDPGSDLAVLLLDPREDEAPWPAVTLGDSDDLLVGETVFAMGNPFTLATDFTPTVTWGVVSGTHRYQPGQGNRQLVYPDCIQVDVPVNPGNSGGPLFNERGEVVGINGRISVRDRGRVNVGVGFAIASNQIRNFLGDLMAGRYGEHGTLDLNAWFMRAPGDSERHGVFVQSVFEDSRVKDFGLQLGDEIVNFCGTPVRSANQLATMVGVLPTDTWVDLTFRPKLESGFGPERSVTFQLSTLDTGSSNDPDRLASDEHRRLAARAVARGIAGEAVNPDGVDLSIRGPDGRVVRLRRRGEQLRIDDGEDAIVLAGESDAFAIDGGEVREATLEEATKLQRILTTNPLLRRAPGRHQLLENGLLGGGTIVFGRPAFVIDLPGDGQRAVFLFEDGSPAGCRYRDPVQKKLVELRFNQGAGSRLVLDGELAAAGWSIDPPSFVDIDPGIFEKPQ